MILTNSDLIDLIALRRTSIATPRCRVRVARDEDHADRESRPCVPARNRHFADDARGLPVRPSEDFWQLSHIARAAMLFPGAGMDHPARHNPDYDFPDDLLPPGVQISHRIARDPPG